MFWQFANSDPYRALSFDRLHGLDLGLYGDHLWGAFKTKADARGRQVTKKIEEQ